MIEEPHGGSEVGRHGQMGFHVVSLIVGLLSVLLSPGSQPRTQGLGEGGERLSERCGVTW